MRKLVLTKRTKTQKEEVIFFLQVLLIYIKIVLPEELMFELLVARSLGSTEIHTQLATTRQHITSQVELPVAVIHWLR